MVEANTLTAHLNLFVSTSYNAIYSEESSSGILLKNKIKAYVHVTIKDSCNYRHYKKLILFQIFSFA